MKYAIVEITGKQFLVDLNKYIKVEMHLKKWSPSNSILFNRVLCVNDNGTILLGKPYLKNVVIRTTTINYFKGRKSIIYKMKPKKKTRIKKGYRPPISLLKVNTITLTK
uniref:Ribosomal protein L21 n=1 Tax=Olisthodiscus luteus TaxID=83000 RepID=A0A7U0QFW1_OLILU|nr:ribosomal protein L21 [Olisthodiscus luteus]YP_010152822.1 ribosomal protein L21 [Olisthodiscus luteus]QQW50469.1 ribosomal protein L21 [Olisthodiscus luteus]QQW50483.1 ribosomal protein L21 [Olisthodiscus luteus]